jgi:DNA helicase II / ATP-dependent DNA helicase PcrA
MAITPAQKAAAEAQQDGAAQTPSRYTRLIAGPGTGKSRTIEKRVSQLLQSGATPDNIYVISFTRATCDELRERVVRFHLGTPHAAAATQVCVSTLHALALRILRQANLLNRYPANPVMLDRWEQKHLYDKELATSLGCTPSRAAQIRLAHDAQWQTLNPNSIAQAQVTPADRAAFNAFHGTRTNLYSCVLPGEVIYQCVENFQMGNLQAGQLPRIEHLIVDEFQDLNACDQEFVRILTTGGAVLFVAGDDDQSIYSFRHADPSGIVDFPNRYQGAATHELTDCFRCCPNVLNPALALIGHNPGRQPKNLNALYAGAAPPVPGTLSVWSFATAQEEACAIAESCEQLLNNGMAGREDEIVILLSQLNPSAIQLDPITQELANRGLPFAPPTGASLTEDSAIRAVYAVLRLVREARTGGDDYIPYRTLLSLLSGVGPTTAQTLADECVNRNANFRQLFLNPPVWLRGRHATAVNRVSVIARTVGAWDLGDTVAQRIGDIGTILSQHVFSSAGQSAAPLATWYNFAGSLPQQTTLSELIDLFSATNENEQQGVLDGVNKRIGAEVPVAAAPKKIRILTMHGAKGLSGKVVFIPSAAQSIMPSTRALQAPGLLIEQRRLFYVSVTRAMAACIISHALELRGAAAFALQQRPRVRLSRSQFLNEMGVPSVNRQGGLTDIETSAIVNDIGNL